MIFSIYNSKLALISFVGNGCSFGHPSNAVRRKAFSKLLDFELLCYNKVPINLIQQALIGMTQLIASLERWFPRKRLEIFGKDSLLKTSLPYYLLTALPMINLFNDFPNPYIFIAITYAVFPLLDEIFSLDERNPSKSQRIQLQDNDPYFRMTLYSAMIISWATFFKSVHMFSTMQITIDKLPYVIGFTFIASNYYASQFAVSHQVMHKPGKFYRILGTLHMLKMYYMHFTYHHLYRHHYEVSTPSDPSTSKKGENVYQFIVRCIVYSWKGVYDDQKKLGKSFFMNYAILSVLGSLAFALGIYLIFGLQSLIVHSIMAFGSIAYLQGINYIQHYGLTRKLLPNNQYEKVTILHSWNAPHRFTNYFFFKLQRHSDHHQNSSKPFQTLLSLDESPFLPHGYTLMILMSFFPKVWFRIMDPLVEAYSELSLQRKEKISVQVKEKAITETRIFLIEIALASIVLLVFSLLAYI